MRSCSPSSSRTNRPRHNRMRVAIGLFVGFLIGAGCRFFDIPSPSPPVLPGALLVVAITLGYTAVDRMLEGKAQAAATKHLCGGPSGLVKASHDCDKTAPI